MAGGGTMDETNGREDERAALAGWPGEQATSGGDGRNDDDAEGETARLASLAWGPSGGLTKLEFPGGEQMSRDEGPGLVRPDWEDGHAGSLRFGGIWEGERGMAGEPIFPGGENLSRDEGPGLVRQDWEDGHAGSLRFGGIWEGEPKIRFG